MVLKSLKDLSKKSNTSLNCVDDIVKVNTKIACFWSNSHGWAPESAADLLQSSMLYWQVDLSKALHIWTTKKTDITKGELILAWANLGSLLENSLKFFLCVYLEDYKSETKKIKKWGEDILPDEAMFNGLINFLKQKELFNLYQDFFITVRNQRNNIHAFQPKELLGYQEFEGAIYRYLQLLLDIEGTIPYPSDHYRYIVKEN